MYLLAPKTYVFAYTEIFATIIFDKLIFNTWYCDLYYEQCWMNPTEIQIPLTAMAFATESVKLLFVSWANLPKHSVLKMEKKNSGYEGILAWLPLLLLLVNY